jgi:hypothetical protein
MPAIEQLPTPGINPTPTKDVARHLHKKFQKIQDECLRVASGPPLSNPWKDRPTCPLDLYLYLSSRVAIYRKKVQDSGMDDLIRKKCDRIRASLCGPRKCTGKEMVGRPYPVRTGWLGEAVSTQHENGRTNCRIKKALRRKWEDRWRAATRSTS